MADNEDDEENEENEGDEDDESDEDDAEDEDATPPVESAVNLISISGPVELSEIRWRSCWRTRPERPCTKRSGEPAGRMVACSAGEACEPPSKTWTLSKCASTSNLSRLGRRGAAFERTPLKTTMARSEA